MTADAEEKADAGKMLQEKAEITQDPNLLKPATELNEAAASEKRAAAIYSGIGAGAQSASRIWGSNIEADRTEADKDAAIHEHAAKHAEQAARDAYDAGKDANALLKAAIDFYKEYTSTQDATRAAALHRA
jgi:hypothetical protein